MSPRNGRNSYMAAMWWLRYSAFEFDSSRTSHPVLRRARILQPAPHSPANRGLSRVRLGFQAPALAISRAKWEIFRQDCALGSRQIISPKRITSVASIGYRNFGAHSQAVRKTPRHKIGTTSHKIFSEHLSSSQSPDRCSVCTPNCGVDGAPSTSLFVV